MGGNLETGGKIYFEEKFRKCSELNIEFSKGKSTKK